MTTRYLPFAKLMLVLLAVAGPMGLYRAWHNDRALLLADTNLKKDLLDKRQLIADELTRHFLTPLLQQFTLRRTMPDGPIEGLQPFPIERFNQASLIQTGATSNADPALLALLRDDSRFASGLPKRYAGLVELLRDDGIVLNGNEMQRFHAVAAELWLGQDLNAKSFILLLDKLPEHLRPLFSQQLCFLGQNGKTRNGGFLASIHADGVQYLLDLPLFRLHELNRRLEALGQNAAFHPVEAWRGGPDFRLTLQLEHKPLDGLIYKKGLVYLGIVVVLELILLLVYVVLIKYERINRAQKQLLAATSHELRTPLAVIRQFAEMLVDRAESFEPRHRTYHSYIHRETLKMQFLVENLLSAARFEFLNLEVNPSRFELSAWIHEIVDSVARLSEDHNIRLDCPQHTVSWDKSLLGQALLNLLENARLHACTDIEVSAVVQEATVTLCIRDFGSEPDLASMKPIQAFRPNRKSGKGLGLGLYLTDRIIKSHGGTMSFEHANPGLAVRISLPDVYGAGKNV